MQKFILAVCLLFVLPVYAEVISGNVRQDEILEQKSVIIDAQTKAPIEGAKIFIPNSGYFAQTDSLGQFSLNASINNNSIMQVEKEGYRPFSITIGKNANQSPLRLELQRASISDIFSDNGLYHLGDNVYSENSANCREFKVKTTGPFYSKSFKMNKIPNKMHAVIVFGSVIGLDTKLAKEMGQNKIASVYSSPAEILFNGYKIGELNLNGDNQEVDIPNSLVKQNNTLTVKTGRNLFQHKRIDYDDIEFANVRIEIRGGI